MNILSFSDADIVFVADAFIDEYGGGAERSTEALFETSPYKVFKIKASQVSDAIKLFGIDPDKANPLYS